MKLILSAGTLYTLPAPRVFEMAREAGFDGMEVIINNDYGGGRDLKLLRSLQGILPVNSIHAPFLDVDGWGNKIDQLKSSVDLALATGVPVVNFHPPSWLSFELKFWRWLKGIDDFHIFLDTVPVLLQFFPCPLERISPLFHKMVYHLQVLQVLCGKETIPLFVFRRLEYVEFLLPKSDQGRIHFKQL